MIIACGRELYDKAVVVVTRDSCTYNAEVVARMKQPALREIQFVGNQYQTFSRSPMCDVRNETVG